MQERRVRSMRRPVAPSSQAFLGPRRTRSRRRLTLKYSSNFLTLKYSSYARTHSAQALWPMRRRCGPHTQCGRCFFTAAPFVYRCELATMRAALILYIRCIHHLQQTPPWKWETTPLGPPQIPALAADLLHIGTGEKNDKKVLDVGRQARVLFRFAVMAADDICP